MKETVRRTLMAILKACFTALGIRCAPRPPRAKRARLMLRAAQSAPNILEALEGCPESVLAVRGEAVDLGGDALGAAPQCCERLTQALRHGEIGGERGGDGGETL